jgi:hypothetical protein
VRTRDLGIPINEQETEAIVGCTGASEHCDRTERRCKTIPLLPSRS